MSSIERGGRGINPDWDAYPAPQPGPRPTDPPAVGTHGTTAAGFDAGIEALAPEAEAAAGRLFSPTLASGDPAQLLKGVKDGRVAIDVPMTPGKYKVKGISFTVPQGATMRVQVEVRDGALVPARDTRGRDTGGGCKVEIRPPIDLPAWLTGNGAYLRDKGQSQAAMKADIGGFFDIKVAELKSTNLADLVKSMGSGDLGGGKKKVAAPRGGESPLPEDLLQLDKATIAPSEVTLNDKVVDTGAIRIDLAPGSKVKLSGSLESAKVEGDVRFDSIHMKQDGLNARVGSGNARFSATLTRHPDGTSTANALVTNLRAELNGLDSRPTNSLGKPDPDHVTLGRASLKDGRLEASVRMGPMRGSLKPQVLTTATSAWFDAAGTIDSAKLTVKDAKDTAEMRVAARSFEGGVAISREGTVALDVDVKGLKAEIKDVQTRRGDGAALDVHHVNVEGDAHFSVDSKTGAFDMNVKGFKLDVRVDDYKGSDHGVTVDAGRTDVTGEGEVKFSSRGGLTIDGKLRAKTEIDDLKVAAPGKAAIDIAKGSKIDAEVTHLSVGAAGKPFALKGSGSVDVGVESYSVSLPGVSAQGTARVKGRTDVEIGEQVLFSNLDATISVAVDDAKVAPGGSGFNLDVARGSKLDLNVKGSTISSDAAKTQIKLGAGSKLDATLDSGEVTVDGRKIQLKSGSRARFDVTSLDARPGQPPALKGKLDIDAKIDGAKVNLKDLPGAVPGTGTNLRIEVGDRGRTNARIKVDDVTMTSDGRMSATGISAKIGTITGATGANGVSVGTLSTAAVKAKTASEIAGAGRVGAAAAALDPLALAKSVKDGRFQVEVPLEGKLVDGMLGIDLDFKKGTVLKLDLEVKDGKIVPSNTRATVSKPGDLPAWVTFKGAYLDEKNTVRLNLGGMKDVPIPGLENMPLEVGKLVDKLTPKPAATPAVPPQGRGRMDRARDRVEDALMPDVDPTALKLSRLKFSVSDAVFAGGRIPVPGGSIDVGETRLSLAGTPRAATVSGRVQLDGMQMTQDGIAVKTGKGSADLNVSYATSNGVATVTTALDRMSIDLDYAVDKRENGDYIHVGQGRVEDASLRASARVPVDKNGLPKGAPTDVDGSLSLPRFTGRIQGGRITIPDGDGTAQVEIGRAAIDGSVSADKKRIEVHGQVADLDGALSRFNAREGATSVNVGAVRVQGSGRVDYDERGLKLDANVKGVELRGGSVRTRFDPGTGGGGDR